MEMPLRVGFLLSGLLHVAVVAAFNSASEQEIPALEEPSPLTLQLAMFKPAQAAPPVPIPVEEPVLQPPPPLEEPVPEQLVPRQEEPVPRPEPKLPEPLAKAVEPKPSPAKPKPRVRRITPAKPVIKKNVETPATKPVHKPALTRGAVTLAKVQEPRPVAPKADVQEKQHYLAALAARINRSKYYPLSSRRRGEEGKVVVRFIVQKNGDITDLTVTESSGSRRLDAAALKTLKRVSPFRPIPESIGREHWSISVPIAFNLSG